MLASRMSCNYLVAYVTNGYILKLLSSSNSLKFKNREVLRLKKLSLLDDIFDICHLSCFWKAKEAEYKTQMFTASPP